MTLESLKVLKTRNCPSSGKEGMKVLNFEPLTLNPSPEEIPNVLLSNGHARS